MLACDPVQLYPKIMTNVEQAAPSTELVRVIQPTAWASLVMKHVPHILATSYDTLVEAAEADWDALEPTARPTSSLVSAIFALQRSGTINFDYDEKIIKRC